MKYNKIIKQKKKNKMNKKKARNNRNKQGQRGKIRMQKKVQVLKI